MSTTILPNFDSYTAQLILSNVFDFLSIEELSQCKRVCSTWNKLILEKIEVRLDFSKSDDLQSLKKKISTFPRVSYIDLSDAKNTSQEGLVYIANNAPNLRAIDLSGCSHLDKVLAVIGYKCISLATLILNECSQLSDKDLQTFMKFHGRYDALKKIELSLCLQITTQGISEILGSSLSFLKLDGCPGVDDSTLKIIGQKCLNLTSLSLAGCSVSDNGLKALTGGPNLREFNVKWCSGITGAPLVKLAFQSPHLQSLDASGCQFTSLTFHALVARVKELQELTLDKCYQLTDSDIITALLRCPQLRYLSIDDCPALTGQSILAAILLGHNLKVFKMGNVEHISCTFNASGSWTHPILDITLFPQITDKELMLMAPSSGHITQLNAKGCTALTSQGLIDLLATACPEIEDLDLTECKQIDYRIVRYLCNSVVYPSPYPIKRLSLQGCFYITDFHLKKEPKIRSFNKLEYLNVNGCIELGHEGILACAGDSSSLTHLFASDTAITDEGWQQLALRFPQLKTLEIGKEITDGGLLLISLQCPNLESLTIKGSSSITETGLSEVLSSCPNMHTLRFYHCSGLADEAVDCIASSGKNIKEFVLVDSPNVNPEAIGRLFQNIKTLETLQLGEQATDAILQELSCSNPQLTSFSCINAKQLHKEGLESLVRNCSHLEVLDLQSCFNVRLGEVKDLTFLPLKRLTYSGGTLLNLPKFDENGNSSNENQKFDENWLSNFYRLTQLDLAGTDCASNTLDSIVNLKALQSLNLAECSGLIPSELSLLSKLQNLRTLNLRGQKIDDQTLCVLVKELHLLEELDLSYCMELSDESLSVLSSACLHLRTLSVEGCRKISDDGLENLLQSCPSLSSLNVKDCPHVFSSVLLKALSKGVTIQTTLWTDQEIDLSDHPSISNQEIALLSKRYPNIRSLMLSGCHSLTDEMFDSLSKFISLEKLDLSNCEGLSPDGLKKLAKLPNLSFLYLKKWHQLGKIAEGGVEHLVQIKSLQGLYLNGGVSISDEDIAEIAKLTCLRHLDLTECSCLSSAIFKNLLPLTKLEILNLSKIPYINQTASRTDYEYLWQMKKLESLDVSWANFGDEGLEVVCEMEALTSLNIEYSPIENGLTSIGKLKALKELNVNDCEVNDSDVYAWRELSELRSLHAGHHLVGIKQGELTDIALSWIALFSKLETLDLSHCGFGKFTEEGMEKLTILKNLRHLNLSGVGCLTGEVFMNFCSSFRKLTSFNFRGISLNASSLLFLSKLSQLEVLHGSHMDNTCLEAISQLSNMRELLIDYSPGVTGEGLRFLRPLIHLRSLELESGSVSSKGLNYLDTLLELKVFTLRYNKVGIDDEFIALRQWRRLEQFVFSWGSFKGVGSQLSFLSRCKNLKKLDLTNGENINSKNLSFLSSLKELEECILCGCLNIDDSVFASLSKLTNLLEELNLLLSNDHFNGQGLSVLRSCEHLKLLDLSSNKSLDVNELLTLGHISVIRLLDVSFSSEEVEKLEKGLPNTQLMDLKKDPNEN